MADLASGIKDGLSIGLSFAKMMEDDETKELQRKNLERELKLREQADPLDIKNKEVDLKRKNLDIERTEGLIENDKVVLDTNRSQRDIQLAYGEESKRIEIAGMRVTNQVNEERANYWSAQTEGIISDNMKANLGSDSTLFNEVLTQLQKPNLTSYELGSIGLMIDGIKSPTLKAQIKNLNPQYAAAWKSILPVLQSGNFEEIPDNFNEGLTAVMKPLLDTAYLGSTFITKEGEGVVEGISFDGNYIAKGRGDQMILGANVKVRINGEEKTYQTFLPDRNDDGSLTFREGLEADDSKAISVSDVVDYASSNAPLAALIYKNPQVMNNISSISNMIEDTYVPENKIAQQQIMSYQKEAYKGELGQYNILLANIDLEDVIASSSAGEGDNSPEMQRALRVFKSKYGDNSGIVFEGGIYKPEDASKTGLDVIFDNAPTPNKIRKMWDGSPLNETVERFSENPDNNQPGAAALINIEGINFGFDTTKEDINATLRNKYKNNNELINAIDFASENFDIAVANGNADPKDYAVSLKDYLNNFYKNAGK